MSPPPAVLPSAVYAARLHGLHEGHALWYPEPHATGEVEIGDVGYIRDGAFVRLLNVRAAAPPVAAWTEAFANPEPLPEDAFLLEPRKRPLAPRVYCSRGVQGETTSARVRPFPQTALELGYACAEAQGAMLKLDGQTSGLRHVGENKRLFKYVLKHHDAWYQYASGTLGLAVRQGEIDLVAGWVKTSSDWVAAVFCDSTRVAHGRLSLSAAPGLGLSLGTTSVKKTIGPTAVRQGKGTSGMNLFRRHHKDQCVFVSRYRVKKKGWLREVKAAAGPRELPRSDGDGCDEMDSPLEPRDAADAEDDMDMNDPLDALLDYILESSDADTAIACDDDLILLLSDKEWPVNMKAYLGRTGPPISVDEDKRWILRRIGRNWSKRKIYFRCGQSRHPVNYPKNLLTFFTSVGPANGSF